MRFVIAVVLCVFSAGAQAALLGRAPLTPGGTDYQAYYDDVLGITWLADANYSQTSGYDADGLMSWSSSLGWIASLNVANHLGTNDWRLPMVIDTGMPGCDFAYTGTDCGFNVDLSTGEMAHLFYSTLGNTGEYDISGHSTGCAAPNCLTNSGPFSNLQPSSYWPGTEYSPNTSDAWNFRFSEGMQHTNAKSDAYYAWAVRPGDIAPVPIPAAAWLFGGALGLLGVARRRLVA